MINNPHVVFGTGAIGLALVEQLCADGHRVRAVNRSGTAPVPEGVDVIGGDASDPEFTTSVTADAAAVYQCLNPAYHRWAHDFPPLQNALVVAARHHRLRYVSFENTYMYGDPGGQLLTETTPHNAHTRKGAVRRTMARQLADLHATGDLDVATARASDYFGPRGTSQSPLGELVIAAALRNKPARVIGNPDQPHSYTYTVDAARTLAALGTRDDVAGEIFHVPNAPALTTREIIDRIAQLVGTPIAIKTTPVFVLRLLGLFNPTIRELPEMLYEFDQPFIVDSSKAEQRLGIEPTPLDQALADTVAWFRDRPS
jgi:nucleoside-diphosphate-sugar epimerase